MKNTFKFHYSIIAILGLISIGLSSCLKDECSEIRRFVEFRPVYLQASEFRVDPEFEESRAFKDPGKIYYYGNYVFINEKFEGVHIIDNSNPETPENLGFISIPGNVDIAIRDNIMYADNYPDLISIDINDIRNPQLLCRDQDVFVNYWQDQNLGYLVRYEATERSMQLECSDPNFGDQVINRGNVLWLADDIGFDANIPAGAINNETAQTGTGGSLARFTIAHGHLYVINNQELTPFDLESNCPERKETSYVAWNIETLFPYKEYLFIGASNGMYIYDASEPSAPQYVSEFRHANACDPVFVKDDIAYVTLRNGTICQNFINQLEIIDVSDIRNPEHIVTHSMDNPHGLSVRDDKLYLCEGAHGLKVFEAGDHLKLADKKIEHIKDIHAIDAISLSAEHLLVIGDDGLYQYNTSEPSDLKEMSYYSVQK